MRYSSLLLIPSLLSAVVATPFSNSRFEVVKRASSNATDLAMVEAEHSLAKRGGTFSGKASFFEPGLGACGTYSTASDYIVAMNIAQYGDTGAISPLCFNTITISYGGKSTQARVVDACPGCPYGGLDMSPGLFNFFADPSVGIFYMSWTIGGGAPAPSPTTSQYVAPTSTYTYTPPATTPTKTYYPPSSTYTPPSSTYTPSSTSSSVAIESATSSSSALNSTATLLPGTLLNVTSIIGNITNSANSTSTGLALLPLSTGLAAKAPATQGNNLAALSQIVLGLGGLVSNAAQAGAKN